MGVIEARKATTAIYRLTENYGTRLRAVEQFTDSELTAVAVTKRREEMLAKSRASAQKKAQNILKVAQDGAAFAESKVDQHRLKVNPDDVAQLTRSAQAWEMTVKPLRDQGKSWFEIAEVLDADGLLALDRFAEQNIRLTEAKGDVPVILANLRAASDRRLAEVHPVEEARTAFKEAAEAWTYANAVATVSGQIENAQSAATAAGAMLHAKRLIHPLGTVPDGAPLSVEQMDVALTLEPYGDTGSTAVA